MSDFFKKALGLFVEIDDTPSDKAPRQEPVVLNKVQRSQPAVNSRGTFSAQDIEKFSKHFNDLFDDANLPGPDYYEFSKMMQLLEAPIADESARIAAVYASLSLQGLKKDKIVETAKHYCSILENDKLSFEKAAAEKASADVEERKEKIRKLDKKIADNNALIQKMTAEINEAQAQIKQLNDEVANEDARIEAGKKGYMNAYQAMYNKITDDIQKINSTLK